MADLISPGVSVTITDESFYIPATANTLPLIFLATKEEKILPDLTIASGTAESDQVRTITSLAQSINLYGVPNFLYDYDGNPKHGDARNEYGLFALNQFLNVGSRAYVVRANIDLDDDRNSVLSSWTSKCTLASSALESLAAATISEYNTVNGFIPLDTGYKTTITQAEFVNLAHTAMGVVYSRYLFSDRGDNPNELFAAVFEGDHSALTTGDSLYNSLKIYSSGYDAAPLPDIFQGLAGIAALWVANSTGATVGHEDEWTPAEAADTLYTASQMFQYTVFFLKSTSLGATDAIRRQSISVVLESTILTNEEIKSEAIEYNLILCPGYPECVDSLVTLSNNVFNEALVIGDPPMFYNPENIVNDWANVESVGLDTRIRSPWLAYYYPHGLGTNLDGRTVVCASSGVALAAYTYSDNVSHVWFAPAGVTRGLVSNSSGITHVGYVSGQAGTATTFVPVSLNLGQRDDLYRSPTNLNPIYNSPATGISLWGQKISMPGASTKATDRVGVVRLAMYIKRSLRKSLVQYLFEPNDKITRENVKTMVSSFLHDIQVKRGLYDFAVLCDDSNNTPDRIDRSELWVDIALKPVKAIEFIYVPIRIVNTGASLTG